MSSSSSSSVSSSSFARRHMRILLLPLAISVVGCVLFISAYNHLLTYPSFQFLLRPPYSKQWHFPLPFPACTMPSCFNFSLCQKNMSIQPLIYPYFHPLSSSPAAHFFSSLPSSPFYTSHPHHACLFLLILPQFFVHSLPHPSTLPYWNGGLNHVIVSFADKWLTPAPHTIGKASILSSQLQESSYRPGFDLSIPLPGRRHFPHLQSLKPFDRKYFLTFKGLRYLGETEGNYRSHPAFTGLHNGHDVIVAVSCNQPTNNKLRKANPKLGQDCDSQEKIHQQYDFADLMNSTFCLTPGGRSPSSYRLIEALSAGAIPVLICDNYVKPFDALIHWHQCLLQFPTSEMHRILPTIRGLSKEKVERRQRYCLLIYNEFLKDDETLLRSTITSLKLRFNGVFSEFTESMNNSAAC